MVDKTLHMTMLFDFFGDLLTEKQKEYFNLYHNEDLSLSEIAERDGISRQGVYDIISRAGRALQEFEQKTGIIDKWRETTKGLERAIVMAGELLLSADNDYTAKLAGELIQTLESIKAD